MATKVYGASDDLIEFGGDVRGEVGSFGTDEREHGILIICSDGTLLEIKYGKADMAIWEIRVLNQGQLFESITWCMDEDANPHSDLVLFKDGLKWAYAAKEWERVK
jgi:hypothetical protein